MGALEVGDVDALDPQRRRVQAKRVLYLLHGLAAGAQIARSLRFVQREGLGRVLRHRLKQRPFVAALRYPQADPAAPAGSEPFGDRFGVWRQDGHQDLTRHGLLVRLGPPVGTCPAASPAQLTPRALRDLMVGDRVIAVHLAEKVLDELAGAEVLDLVHNPPALSAYPAVAHVEDLDGGLQLVLDQPDHVAVRAVGQHDGLLLQCPLQRLQVVAQSRRPLELLGAGRLVHRRLESPGELAGLAGHEVAELLGQLPVVLRADPADAGSRALADVAQQAWAADLAGPLEYARRAGADREDAQERIDGVPDRPRMRVGAKVPDPAPLGAAQDRGPGELLVHGDGEVRIALVVAVPDVPARIELLDPGVFELQCLDLGADYRPLDAGGVLQHPLRPRRLTCEVGEVRVQPGAQVLGLADIDHAAALVAELIDAWRLRNRARRRPVRRRICHAATLFPRGDRHGRRGGRAH